MHRKDLFIPIVVIIFIVFKLWLVSALSIGIHAEEAFDDFLFIKQADSILNGQWLGEFNNLTLAKGPFYPIFIAISHQLGIPLLVSQQLLYAAACVFTALLLYFVAKKYRKKIFIVSFLILLFNPFTFDGNLNLRVNRPAIYQSLSLLTLTCFLITMTFVFSKKYDAKQFIFSALGGVFLAFAWMTREESVWLLTTITFIYICILYISMRRKRTLQSLTNLVITLFTFSIFFSPVVLLNKSKYGHFILTEYQHPSFIAAYGALTRVKSDHFTPYLTVPRNVRTKISLVSPIFASISCFFEDNPGKNWATITKNEAPLENNEFDIGGGWFMWAFRDAVAAAGHYKSLSSALTFYQQLADEINSACDRKVLDCIPRRNTFVPPWNYGYFPNIKKYSLDLLNQLFFLISINFSYSEVKEPQSSYQLVKMVTLEQPHVFDKSVPQARIILLITQIYRMILIPSFLFGLILYVLQLVKRGIKFLFSVETLLILAVLLGIISLAGILVLLAATSYPLAINSGYFGPLPPLILVVVILLFITWINFSQHKTSRR